MIIQYSGGYTDTFRMMRWTMGGLQTVGFASSWASLPGLVIILLIGWLTGPQLDLFVCGEEMACMPGHYAEVERLWQDGDAVELTLDMRVMPIRPEDYGVSSGEAPYMALRRGPLVLARDARLGQSVDAPVELVQNDDGSVAATLSEHSPVRCVVAMDVQLADGTTMPVIDYASAGKLWTQESRMAAWMLTE